MIILDSSALLAYLFREAGHRIVEKYIESACISTGNLSEVAGRFTEAGLGFQQAGTFEDSNNLHTIRNEGQMQSLLGIFL